MRCQCKTNFTLNILVSCWSVSSVKCKYVSKPGILYYPVYIIVWRGGGWLILHLIAWPYFLIGKDEEARCKQLNIYLLLYKGIFFLCKIRDGSCTADFSLLDGASVGTEAIHAVWVSLAKEKSKNQFQFSEKCVCMKHTYKLVNIL